jgi:hypothetical protein
MLVPVRQLAVLELNEQPPLAYQLFLLSRKVLITHGVVASMSSQCQAIS